MVTSVQEASLATFNDTQWTGDFLNSGITAIAMDVRNFARQDVELRIALTGEPNSAGAAASPGIPVVGNADWHTIEIPIAAADLTNIGSGSLNDLLANVTRMADYP